MYQTLLSIFIPPLAICRYGSAACCIYPISGIWLGGLALFAYHFLTTHHINPLTEQGSLYGGLDHYENGDILCGSAGVYKGMLERLRNIGALRARAS